MLMLMVFVSTAMAQFTQNYYMDSDFWSNAESCPEEISTVLDGAKYDDGTAWKGDNSVVQYASNEITVETDGNVVVTFTHQGGNHMLCILGVDVVDAEGNVVENDYHVGSAGGSPVNNVYTLEGLTAGATLTLRSFVCDNTAKGDRTARAQGYYTVTNVVVATTPAVDTDGDELMAKQLYRLKHKLSDDKYIHITGYNAAEKIQIKSKSNSTDQFFELVPTGSANEYKLKSASGYYVQNTGSWNCQAVTSGSTPYLVEEKEEGIYLLKSAQGYFGTNEGVTAENAPLYTNHPVTRNGATWTFEKVGADVVNTLAGFNPNKMYTVSTTTRGGWSVGATSERFESTTDGGLGTVVDPTNTRNQFAVLSANGTDYYLFSVHANKFVKADRTTVAGVADALNFTDASSQGAGRVMVNFRDIDNKYINLGGDKQMVINGWGADPGSEIDGGNSVLFVECGDFDPTAALAMLSNVVDVTYNFVCNGVTLATQTVTVSKNSEYPAFNVTLPLGYEITEQKPEGTVTATVTEEITVVVNNELLPFEAVAEGTPETWYYAQMHYYTTNNYSYRWFIAPAEDGSSVRTQDHEFAADEVDAHLWGFVGTVEGGFKMVNKTTGKGIKSENSGVATMADVDDATAFIAMGSKVDAGWFCLKNPKGNYLNSQGKVANASNCDFVIAHWSDNDGGSSFLLTEYVDEDVTVNVSELGWATKYFGESVHVPAGVNAYIITGVNEYGYVVKEQIAEGEVIPANTGVLLEKAGEHKFAKTVSYNYTLAGNLLNGSVENRYVAGEAYVLANPNEAGVGFYKAELNKDEDGNDGVTHFLNNAGKAYLVLPTASETAAFYGLDWDGTTGIEGVEVENEVKAIYDLTGRRVEAITAAGIYIVNGKKVLVK